VRPRVILPRCMIERSSTATRVAEARGRQLQRLDRCWAAGFSGTPRDDDRS
jgi:hypothetical protein